MDQEQFRIELNKEREYVEKNFYTRFNIYILFISLFVTAGATIITADKFCYRHELLTGVLLLGTIISILIARSLYVTYKILEIILTRRDEIDEIAKYILYRHPRLHSNRILGIIIPIICTFFLFTNLTISIILTLSIKTKLCLWIIIWISIIISSICFCWIYKIKPNHWVCAKIKKLTPFRKQYKKKLPIKVIVYYK